MKQRIIIHIVLIIFLLSIGMQLKAQATESATPTASDKAKQIDDLKERLATKVAELKQSQRQAILCYRKIFFF